MYPIEFDAAIVKVGDGATTEVFTILCGLENASLAEKVNTTDKFRHDCAKPGAISTRSVRVNSRQWDITATGVTNATNVTTVGAYMGAHKNYQVDVIQYDGTDTGKLLGTFAGQAVMTSRTFNVQRQADSAFDVALAGENNLVWTPAP